MKERGFFCFLLRDVTLSFFSLRRSPRLSFSLALSFSPPRPWQRRRRAAEAPQQQQQQHLLLLLPPPPVSTERARARRSKLQALPPSTPPTPAATTLTCSRPTATSSCPRAGPCGSTPTVSKRVALGLLCILEHGKLGETVAARPCSVLESRETERGAGALVSLSSFSRR